MVGYFKKHFFLRKDLEKEINRERQRERAIVEKEFESKIKKIKLESKYQLDVLENTKNAEISRFKQRISVLEGERRNTEQLKQFALRKINEAVNIANELRYHFEQSSQSLAKTFTIYDDLADKAEILEKETRHELEHH